MNILQKFRTSFGGFHRGDVVNYIERTSKAHAEEVDGLKKACAEELAALQTAHAEEVEALKQALEDAQTKQQLAEKERNESRAVLQKFTEAYAEAKAILEE